jgi:hypothetical protein
MIVSKVQNQSKSKQADSSQSAPANASAMPNACCVHTEIRERAYQMFEERGSGHGHEMQDWLRAERQVMAS